MIILLYALCKMPELVSANVKMQPFHMDKRTSIMALNTTVLVTSVSSVTLGWSY